MNATQARSVFQSKHRFTVTPYICEKLCIDYHISLSFSCQKPFFLIFVFVFVLKELVCQIETLQDSKV